MRKFIFIFAVIMIVGIQVTDAADNVRSIEDRLSALESGLGTLGARAGIHQKEIGSIYHKADNASHKADNALKEVYKLKKVVCKVKEHQQQQDLFMHSLLKEPSEPLLSDEEAECLASFTQSASASSEGKTLSGGDVDYLRTAMAILFRRTYTSEKKVLQQQAYIDGLKSYIALLTYEQGDRGYEASDDDNDEGDKPPLLPFPLIVLRRFDPEDAENE